MLLSAKQMALHALVLALTLLVLPLVALAQQASVDIHGHHLSLGMPRQAVLQKFEDYRVHCFEESKSVVDCNSLVIQAPNPPYDALAHVGFKDGKIKSIRKYWSRGYEGSKPDKFVQTLYSLLMTHSRQSATPFTISVTERRDPGVLQQSIFLTSGRKTIEISYVEGLPLPDGKTYPPFVNLDEKLE